MRSGSGAGFGASWPIRSRDCRIFVSFGCRRFRIMLRLRFLVFSLVRFCASGNLRWTSLLICRPFIVGGRTAARCCMVLFCGSKLLRSATSPLVLLREEACWARRMSAAECLLFLDRVRSKLLVIGRKFSVVDSAVSRCFLSGRYLRTLECATAGFELSASVGKPGW